MAKAKPLIALALPLGPDPQAGHCTSWSRLSIRIGRTDQHRNRFGGRHRFVQQLKALRGNLGAETDDASKIAAGTTEARHQAEFDRIAAHFKNDWDGPRRRLGGHCRSGCLGEDHRHPLEHEISSKLRQPLRMAVRRVVLYGYVAAF
jgi:hypothetical protein